MGFRYIAEKVSHHPPIMACHAEAKNYTYYQDSLLKTKFWGKSMELNNIGVGMFLRLIKYPPLITFNILSLSSTS